MRAIGREFALNYKRIYLASFDVYAFRLILKQNPKASLYGFDDGTANITQSSIYYRTKNYKKSMFYERLMNLPKVDEIKQRLVSHFSIFPGFENIVDPAKLKFVQAFDTATISSGRDKQGSSFFIGQPFDEYLNQRELEMLRNLLMKEALDFYIPHPRERKRLLPEVPVLDTEGLLAEDKILESVRAEKPRVVSGFSTVLFNLPEGSADKVMYLSSTAPDTKGRAMLAEKAGCRVRYF